MVKLEHVIAWLSCNGDGSIDTSVPSMPEAEQAQALETLNSTLTRYGLHIGEIADAANEYAAACAHAGFDRGFRSGVRLVLDLFAIARPEPEKII